MFVRVGYSAQVDILTRLVVIEHRVQRAQTGDRRTAPALSGPVPTPQPERTRAQLIKPKLQMMPPLFMESNGNDKSDEQESPDQWVASGNWAPSRTFSRQLVSHRGRSLLSLTEEEYMEALDKEEKGDGLRKRPNHLP